MKAQTPPAVDTAISRLAIIGAHSAMSHLADDHAMITLDGRDMLTMADARAVMRWARGIDDSGDNEWNATARIEAEAALFDPRIDIIAIAGPSGSGKTRLVRHLMRVAEVAGSVLCVCPSLAATSRYAAAMREEGGPTNVGFSESVGSFPHRFVALESPEASHDGAAGAISLALQNTATHRNRKVIVAFKEEGNLHWIARNFGRVVPIALSKPVVGGAAR